MKRKRGFAEAIVMVGNGITREKRWLRSEIHRRTAKLTRAELCAVKDLVTTMARERDRIGPRNRRFLKRRTP
jgi:hypothetical protein